MYFVEYLQVYLHTSIYLYIDLYIIVLKSQEEQ